MARMRNVKWYVGRLRCYWIAVPPSAGPRVMLGPPPPPMKIFETWREAVDYAIWN